VTEDSSTEKTLTQGGRVVRLVTDDELIMNLGSAHGVLENMIFDILDPSTQNIIDPDTHENLGSIERVKAQVRVINVSERISLARVHPLRGRAGVSSASEALMGRKPPSTRLSNDVWPDGVTPGDPVKFTGDNYTRNRVRVFEV
jgi:hypothetical protein